MSRKNGLKMKRIEARLFDVRFAPESGHRTDFMYPINQDRAISPQRDKDVRLNNVAALPRERQAIRAVPLLS